MADTDEKLRDVLQEEALTCISEIGFTKPLSTVRLTDKVDIVSSIQTFHLFIKAKAVMDQFKAGLQVAGVHQYMTKHCELMKPLFVNERTPLTSSMLTTFL